MTCIDKKSTRMMTGRNTCMIVQITRVHGLKHGITAIEPMKDKPADFMTIIGNADPVSQTI